MSITKRLDEAREAYKNKDLNASAAAHKKVIIAKSASEKHGGVGSQYIGSMVYGGLDGIVTTFAVVSGVAGADLGASVILILGMANLFADGFSMAIGAYLSEKSEKEYYDIERSREAWEVENFPEGERQELIELYQQNGYTDIEAHDMVAIISKDKERWVDTMMVDELGLLKDDKKPFLSGVTTFVSFVLAGVLPLLPYLIRLAIPISSSTSFWMAIALSGIALFSLGAAKVKVTGLKPLRSGLEMLIVGGLAAAVAYVVGVLLKGIGG